MLGGEVLAEWQSGLDDLLAVIAGRFSRVEPRRLAFAYVRGLLAPLERRSGWTIAEHAGDGAPQVGSGQSAANRIRCPDDGETVSWPTGAFFSCRDADATVSTRCHAVSCCSWG